MDGQEGVPRRSLRAWIASGPSGAEPSSDDDSDSGCASSSDVDASEGGAWASADAWMIGMVRRETRKWKQLQADESLSGSERDNALRSFCVEACERAPAPPVTTDLASSWMAELDGLSPGVL